MGGKFLILSGMKKIVIICVALILLLIIPYFFGGALGIELLERIAPTVKIRSVTEASEPGIVEVTVADAGKGLSSLTVAAEQKGQTHELLQTSFDGAKKEETVRLSLIKFKALAEGPAVIKVSATDAAFHRNKAEGTLPILIDYSPPRMQLLSLQHVASQGGAEFVVYKVDDSNLSSHGVQVGDFFFRGYPAAQAGGPSLTQEGIFVSLFAIPLGYGGGKPELIANDEAGNITKIPLYFNIKSKKQNEVEMSLKESFYTAKNSELYPGYLRMAAEMNDSTDEKPADLPEAVWKFRHINKNYRALLEQKLREMANASNEPRLWRDVFIKPMPSATSSTFGEKRQFLFNGHDTGNTVHNGLDLASVNADAVHAANDGKVVLAGDFGIYGNAVYIDHGLGLFSLYGHLSSIAVREGDTVTRGFEIGRTGQTGLAGGDHLHFEFRVREVPVDPIEWWDAKWIKDNIDGKLEEVKSQATAE